MIIIIRSHRKLETAKQASACSLTHNPNQAKYKAQ
jgi:hypothetical protein